MQIYPTEFRNNLIDRFSRIQADIIFKYHPLRTESIIILNNTERDMYGDNSYVEIGRVKKLCVIKKELDQMEVPDITFEDEPELLEDGKEPWVFVCTTTDLPRYLKQEDQILCKGIKYTISRVYPVNKLRPSLVRALIYAEHQNQIDELGILRIDIKGTVQAGNTVILDILYSGYPLQISYNDGAFEEFYSYRKVTVPTLPAKIPIVLKNGETEYRSFVNFS